MPSPTQVIHVWPLSPGQWFDGIQDHLTDATELELEAAGDLASGAAVLLMLAGDLLQARTGLAWLEEIDIDDDLNVVVVTDDSYLGTDAGNERAMISGAAVAVVRSLAVKRGTRNRVNAICLPESLFGAQSEMRAPLPGVIELADLVSAIDFLTGPDAGYISGQVLFVDGGRQLFSSLTS